ncbi:MAG: DNA recombination protein RmuC [Candidatus Pacebacteria bacterium]|nr:DNA recombination protein RmuC [Candidatus Paceibacterota bacterium]
MQTTDYIVIGVLALVFILVNALLAWFVMRRGKGSAAQDTQREQMQVDTQAQRMQDGFGFLQKELQEMRQTFDSKIGENTRDINASVRTQLSESQKMMATVTKQLADVKKEVGSFGETNKQVIGFSEQLKNLSQVLQNPKQRGVLGEYYLETVLQNVLPPDSYKVQYTFPSGEIADAVVFVKDKIVPIDSKFSLENYNRMIEADGKEKAAFEKVFINDLKLRIKETSKYIKPQDGTMEFAFMFIPSEGIYYDLLTNKIGGDENLLQKSAREDNVIIVSPTSFLAYLQTVLQGLKALEVEEKAQDIIKNVSKLTKHISKYEELYGKLGNTLGTAVNHYNAGYKELGKIDKDVFKISGENADIDIDVLDKPQLD